MARRSNELYVGNQYLAAEGRSVKHPGLINCYATPTVRSKVRDKPIELYGIDIETDYKTAELKLLGFWNGSGYLSFTDDFLEVICAFIRGCGLDGYSIAYWNKLDPFILYKQFLLQLSKDEQYESMGRFGKVSGDWDKDNQCWRIKPVVEIKLQDTYFGIKNVIRSCIQFYYRKEFAREPTTVWAYDIAQLYEKGLEIEMANRKDKFSYYSKIGESAHKVDWELFETDEHYRNDIVLKSNELDARAVYDLGMLIQDEFYKVFRYYPCNLISQGAFARSAIVATIYNKYEKEILDPEALDSKVMTEVKSIGIKNYLDTWKNKFGENLLKELYCMVCECYSGGYVETIRYGYAGSGYYSDIASAYSDTERQLYDLRDCKITTGIGEPPHIKNSYCYIRGEVDIPISVNFHPVTIKHPVAVDTNVRVVGNYIATYTIEERDFLKSLGTNFGNEKWINIETTGVLSPLAECVDIFAAMRDQLIFEGNSAQWLVKTSMSAIYGITFEAVDTYSGDGQSVIRSGYRAGEFFNPIYASIITSQTRIKLSKAATNIERVGGEVILLMTDCVYWKGTADMLPAEMWSEKKTIGYFEKPKGFKDFICLGSGRYEYTDLKDGKKLSKTRGLNIVEIHDLNDFNPEDVITGSKKKFSWLDSIRRLAETGGEKLQVKVKTLISVGVVLHNSNYKVADLGLIAEETRDVDPVVGKIKRNYDDEQIKDIKLLSTSLIETEPHYWGFGITGQSELYDNKLPLLREEVMKREVITSKDLRKAADRRSSKKYNEKDDIKERRKNVYHVLLELGYSADEARQMKFWGNEKMQKKLKEDKKV